MKRHAAFIAIAFTILSLLALTEFTPQGWASKDKRLPERTVAKRDSKPNKASKRRSGTLKSTVKDQDMSVTEQSEEEGESDADLSPRFKNLHIDKETYLRMRDEY